MERRHAVVLRNGFADQFHRSVIAAILMGDYPKKMPGVDMARISLQDALVQPLGLGQASGLMVPQGDGEHLLNARRRLRHKLAPSPTFNILR